MSKITEIFEESKLLLAQHPLFSKIQDSSKPIEQRLSFLPAMSHFVMSLSDLNKFSLYSPFPKDSLEKAINTHANEDSHHWPWFLHDLQILALNSSTTLVDKLRFIWSDRLQASRQLTYELFSLTKNKPAKQKLVVIEVSETAGNIFFSAVASMIKGSEISLKYLGDLHLSHETGHLLESDSNLLSTLDFSPEEEKEALSSMKLTFQAFNSLLTELSDFS